MGTGIAGKEHWAGAMKWKWFIGFLSMHDNNFLFNESVFPSEGDLQTPFELFSKIPIRTEILGTRLIRQRSHFDLRGATSTPRSTHAVCSDDAFRSRIQNCRCSTD
jgi:hypothetical protein